MSTTDILFDSPALNSLKRAQLVRLCKHHDLKTTGKNSELICRLKEYARVLPSDAPLSIAVLSDDSLPNPYRDEADEDLPNPYEDDETIPDSQRTSQILEDIAEVSESRSRSSSANSKNSLASSGSAGEFGASKSSLFASIASSMGLKRSTSANSIDSTKSKDQKSEKSSSPPKSPPLKSSPSKSSIAFSMLLGRNRGSSQSDRDSLTTHAIPYESIPASRPSHLPHTDHFTLHNDELEGEENMSVASIDRPVPGLGPSSSTNAIAAAGSTIRLITSDSKTSDLSAPPNLPAIVPSFDLVPPTPGKSEIKCWPMSPSPTRKHYHKFDFDHVSEMDEDEKGVPTSPSRPSEPFVFGSPNPRHSTTPADFSNAAASIIAEMNSRLGATGARPLHADVLNAAAGPMSPASVDELLKYEFGAGRTKNTESAATIVEGTITNKFDRAHEKEFSRMEGIDSHYAAKRGESGKATEPLNIGKKRKSTVLNNGKLTASGLARKRQSSNVRVISTGTRRRVIIPGAFGDDDDDEDEDVADEEGARGAKRACIGESRKVSIAPSALKEKEEAEAKKRQSEAVKRQLALNKQRRRSSRAAVRPNIGVPKPKPRFGFLTTAAKSIVKSVWNRGGSSKDAVITPAPRKSAAPTRKESLAKKPSLAGLSAPSIGSANRVRLSTESGSPATPTSDPAPAVPEKAGAVRSEAPKDTHPAPALAPPTRLRKPSNAPALANTSSKPALTRTSRLTAPTASSLAKMNVTAQTKANAGTVPAASSAPKSRSTTTVSKPKTVVTRTTSKIPVTSPSKKPASSSFGTRIFSKPLRLPSAAQAKKAEETGKRINPITGAVSPRSPRQPFSSAGSTGLSLMGVAASIVAEKENLGRAVNGSGEELRNPEMSAMKKPRISRSKIKERLGSVQRARSPFSPGHGGSGSASPSKKRVSSPRKSAGGAKARGSTGAGASGVLMSAKKRARAGEAAKRKSTRASTAASSARGQEMDVDA